MDGTGIIWNSQAEMCCNKIGKVCIQKQVLEKETGTTMLHSHTETCQEQKGRDLIMNKDIGEMSPPCQCMTMLVQVTGQNCINVGHLSQDRRLLHRGLSYRSETNEDR